MAFASSIAPFTSGLLSFNPFSSDSNALKKIYPSPLSLPHCHSMISNSISIRILPRGFFYVRTRLCFSVQSVCQGTRRKVSTFHICATPLREGFYHTGTMIAMGIIGPGLIGSTLLDQLRDQASVLKEKFHIDLRVIGIIDSKTMLLSDLGIDLTKWRELRKEKGEVADLEKFVQNVHQGDHLIPNTVFVDCTSDSRLQAITVTGSREEYMLSPQIKRQIQDHLMRLRALQQMSYPHYFYEATVGAGPPIISTLQDLLGTGDKILRIEGIFSGTLSYIFNKFKGTQAFSELVMEAKKAGYTEPDPRDDLSGEDVARKVLILARECGLKLERSDVRVENLVPEPMRGCASAEEYLQQLQQYDHELAKERQDAEDEGEVLRYVGVVDVVNQKGGVELGRYKKDHPFAHISECENIIIFTTERYMQQPLIVHGPGAGAQVTASGIFSDILRLAPYLGALS